MVFSHSASADSYDVCVLGTGYIGLPLCVMLAKAGKRVLGVDVQEQVVDSINRGDCPFDEEDLAIAFAEPGVRARLKAQLTPESADVFVVAVPTPVDHRRRVADLSYVESAMSSILPLLQPGNLVIIESTVPPLTCQELVTPMLERAGHSVGTDVLLAHCPERILPGNVVQEIHQNDRIIGGTTPEAAERAREVYATFVCGELILTDDVTAELCKLMENTYRDVNIALANEFAAVSETLGVNVLDAIGFANRHPRVDILRPGIGTGGHCIPIDPWFIRQVDPDNARLIDTARRINSEVPARIAAKIRKSVADIESPTIVVVGVSYKPNSSDCRESPALEVINHLAVDGYQLVIADPMVSTYAWPDGGLVELAKGADLLVVLVEHKIVQDEIREKSEEIEGVMRTPRLLRFFDDPTTSTIERTTQS